MPMTTDSLEPWHSFQPLPVSPVPTGPDLYELTEEQVAEVERFVQARIAAMLSTTPSDAEAEAYLGQAYGVVGLEPPRVRWFDSPIAFALAPDLPPQSLELLLRTSVEARVVAMCAERVNENLWGALTIRLLEPIGDRVVPTVSRLIERAAFAHIGQSDPSPHPTAVNLGIPARHGDLWEMAEKSFWDTAKRSLPMPWMERRIRVEEGVKAYRSATWFAQATCFAHILGPHDLLPLARFNELVSGYRLGRHEAWLVRKPDSLALDEHGSLHAEDGMCLRYRDGWGFYAWHGRNASEQFILRPETLTLEDWLREPHGADRNTIQRDTIQERIGHHRFSEMVGGFRIRNEQLMVDLGQGKDLEPTGYSFYRRGEPGEPPRVCRTAWVLFQYHCANGCPFSPPCPDAAELVIRPEEPPEETP